MNLPNALTILRIILTIGFIFFMTQNGLAAVLVSTVLFAVAAFTDFLDGYYAKKHNLVSNFGKIMDPIADKFLILTVFFVFMHRHLIAAWMFYIIFAREIIVTGYRFMAMKKGKVLAAERTGKYKTSLQMFAVFVILFFIIFQEAGIISRWPEQWETGWLNGIYIVMLFAVSLTLISGISYLWNDRKSSGAY